MPAQRTFGMDHPHHEWSPIISRPALRWPNGAAVALCVVLVLEHMEWQAPDGSFQVANLSGGSAPRAFPDYARLSHREYGHRVGIFRLLDLLDKHGIPATIAMDAMTAENYPYLVQHCISRGCEIIGHGISVSRTISANMSEDEERGYIRSSIDSLIGATGSAPQGWFGPEYGESDRTPQLLAEAGIRYVCDWANDEQPYPMTTGDTPFFALPLLYELDDVASMAQRKVTVADYQRRLTESFDTLLEDGASNGRVMALNWHPWMVGQPFRVGAADAALGHMMRTGGVWAATGSEIVEHFQSQTA
ncbi:MAG: polysaccharide deacetylase family protein [Chloroflexi bacterium]|nr:polysaccharide deacetylase family protein [Chloroflexota bacterium]